jgi:hypothetical protein
LVYNIIAIVFHLYSIGLLGGKPLEDYIGVCGHFDLAGMVVLYRKKSRLGAKGIKKENLVCVVELLGDNANVVSRYVQIR